MNNRTTNDDIWKWYQHLEDYKLVKDTMNQREYCTKHNLNYIKFHNYRFKIYYKKYTHPDLYKKLVKLYKDFPVSPLTFKAYAEANDINHRWLTETSIHLLFIEVIEEKLKSLGLPLPALKEEIIKPEPKPAPEPLPKPEENPMTFYQVPTSNLPFIPSTSHSGEIIEKQNDIEITISQGVKVSIAPNIDSMKIIKIIELLKDL